MIDKTAIKPARRFARTPAEENGGTAASGGATLPAPHPESKIARVARLLERIEGASLDELVAATSRLPHTTRGALTGLKKTGRVISKSKVDDVTRYATVKVNIA